MGVGAPDLKGDGGREGVLDDEFGGCVCKGC